MNARAVTLLIVLACLPPALAQNRMLPRPAPQPRPPIPKFPISDPNDLEEEFITALEGEFFAEFDPVQQMRSRVRRDPNSVQQPRPPANAPPKINTFPQQIKPVLPPSNPNIPKKQRKTKWMTVVSAMLDPVADPNNPYLTPLPSNFILESGTLVTAQGIELSMTLTEISTLAAVPTFVSFPGEGDWDYVWDFSDFTTTVGRFYLMEVDVTLGNLLVPEPGTLGLTGLTALAVLRRRPALRPARRGPIARTR